MKVMNFFAALLTLTVVNAQSQSLVRDAGTRSKNAPQTAQIDLVNTVYKGEMSCTVTGNVVVSSEDGKFKQYAGFKDGVKSGDPLRLEYSFSNHGAYMALSRNDRKEGSGIISTYIGRERKGNFTIHKNGLILSDGDSEKASFLQDYIRIENIFGELYLHRYYKNDWHGIFINSMGPDLTSHTMTINCRHNIDSMENIYKAFSK